MRGLFYIITYYNRSLHFRFSTSDIFINTSSFSTFRKFLFDNFIDLQSFFLFAGGFQ